MAGMRNRTTLDPDDWDAFRATAHMCLDHCIDLVSGVSARPVWKPLPEDFSQRFNADLPRTGRELASVMSQCINDVMQYPTGNIHPRFFGWVHGSGNMAAFIADIVASAMNSNCGGRDHAAIYVERQVVEWCKKIFKYPDKASGVLTGGTSAATILAFAAARQAYLDREGAQHDDQRLRVAYCSSAAHSCVKKAFRLLGFPTGNLRRIPTVGNEAISLDCLRAAIREDRKQGVLPFLLIGSAGTVNSGGFDDLEALAQVAAAENLWFHVDAAFGAWAVLAGSRYAAKLKGIELSDSLAFDFHKWMSVQYDAGCVLIRDRDVHARTFASRPDYLAMGGKALAGGEPWPCDFGFDLSRGFRALKVWFSMSCYGLDRLGEAIASNCALASRLGELVASNPELQLLSQVELNICCFRFVRPDSEGIDLNAINRRIVEELQSRGIAAPSTTTVAGVTAIRAAIVNHRTTTDDIQILVKGVLSIGRSLC